MKLKNIKIDLERLYRFNVLQKRENFSGDIAENDQLWHDAIWEELGNIYVADIIWDGNVPSELNLEADDDNYYCYSYIHFLNDFISVLYDFLITKSSSNLISDFVVQKQITTTDDTDVYIIFINAINVDGLIYISTDFLKKNIQEIHTLLDSFNLKYDDSNCLLMKTNDSDIVASNYFSYSPKGLILKLVDCFDEYQINPYYDPKSFSNTHYQELLNKVSELEKMLKIL